ncbi:hypothetical protein AlacWU_02687 [Aspergillus niger]|nr:hypothetical protein AlacWU_02687 [Aspergillus niger]
MAPTANLHDNLDNSGFSATLSAPGTPTSTRIAKNLHDNVSGLEDINAQPRVLAAKVAGADPLRAIDYDRLWIRPASSTSYGRTTARHVLVLGARAPASAPTVTFATPAAGIFLPRFQK